MNNSKPLIVVQQAKSGEGPGFKIRKEDLKLLQQCKTNNRCLLFIDCENDILELPQASLKKMQMTHGGNFAIGASHQKTKSQGATPLGNPFSGANLI